MSDTLHLELPLIAGAQAQKHVTHNEALAILDQLIHLAVISRALAAPPPSPLDGDRYLIAAGPTGAWATHAGEIAFYLDGVWRFAAPRNGWRLWSIAEQKLFIHDGAGWHDAADIDELQNMALLGINTAADTVNKFAVKSAAMLHTAITAAEGGSGDVQHKLNKEADGDTASFLFQKNFSGRAEIGLTGDNDFHFKVSPDGAAWHDALVLDKDDGTAKHVAGSVSAPGVGIGAVNDGIYQVSAGHLGFAFGGVQGFRANANGIGIGADPASSLQFVVDRTGANALGLRLRGETSSSLSLERYSADSSGPLYSTKKGRGTISAPGQTLASDSLGGFDSYGIDNTGAERRTGLFRFLTASDITTTSAEARIVGSVCPSGSLTLTEILRFEHATGFSMFGANPVINQNRHFRKRQYAAGSLPSQNSGDEIASSDIVAAPLVSDGTQWTSPGVKVLNAVAANTTISIPAGWAIDQIHFANTTANAVTGGIKIGTTSGATDVVAAQAIGANALDTIADASVLKKVFSRSAAQTLHIQAVTAWNGASLELSFVVRKVF